MKNTWLMTWYTLREALARKVFIAFFIISVLVILLAIALVSFMDPTSFFNSATQNQQKFLKKEMVTGLELMILAPSAFLGLVLSIISSASFVPVMLEKGNIDLLISKPVSRTQLLLGKFLGGLLVVLLNVAFLIIGIWLVISLKFGYWDAYFLNLIFVITFVFAVLYSLMVLFGVWTKSSTSGMMTALLIYIILSPLLYQAKDKGKLFIENETIRKIVEGIYYIVPKTQELMTTVAFNVSAGKAIEDFQPVISSFIFLILMMYFAIIMFKRKDF